jgi:hypothetical protein
MKTTKYPDHTAQQNEFARIRADVARRRDELKDSFQITRDTLLALLWTEATTGKGAVRVTAIMGMAKLLGFLVDKVDISGSVEHTHKLAQLSDGDLDYIIARGVEARQLREGSGDVGDAVTGDLLALATSSDSP